MGRPEQQGGKWRKGFGGEETRNQEEFRGGLQGWRSAWQGRFWNRLRRTQGARCKACSDQACCEEQSDRVGEPAGPKGSLGTEASPQRADSQWVIRLLDFYERKDSFIYVMERPSNVRDMF